MPIDFTCCLVDHMPLPDGLDFSPHSLWIDFPEECLVHLLDVNLVVVASVARHFVTVRVVMAMPTPPKETLVVHEFGHRVIRRSRGKSPIPIVAAGTRQLNQGRDRR